MKTIPPTPLTKPPSCNGCVLDPISSGFMSPSLSTSKDRYKVTLLGEALGEEEVKYGQPFQGKAGFKLNRLLEWAGLDRSKFDILNSVWCQPPDNKLEGEWYEKAAVAQCGQTNWHSLLNRSNVVVPMGNVALNGLVGRKGILSIRGYILDSNNHAGIHILPTVHPSFIQRGMSKYSAAFIHDVQKAVEVARGGLQFVATNYLLDPSPLVAYDWAKKYRDVLSTSDQPIRLAYDIETPGKGVDEGDVGDDDGDRTFFIWRVGFSYRSGEALSVPFTPEYIPAIKLLLGSAGEKVVWNAGFDNPRLRHNGIDIEGVIHDGMVAWHILHSDLPKGLGFVATFTCPFQPPWKHLSVKAPAFYNATDADVELTSFEVIERELHKSGLWDVYQRDVLDLEPILIHMTREGMPLDAEIRYDRAVKLAVKQDRVKDLMEQVVPEGARKIEHVYTNTPKITDGLKIRGGVRAVAVCPGCGLHKPRKDHFKRTVKTPNPCADLVPNRLVIDVKEYYRLAPFKPSRDQLMRYQTFLGRPIPTTFDNKTKERKQSMGEKQLKGLMKKYLLDSLYPLVLEYRELDKIAGTYIGRPAESA